MRESMVLGGNTNLCVGGVLAWRSLEEGVIGINLLEEMDSVLGGFFGMGGLLLWDNRAQGCRTSVETDEYDGY